VRGKNHQGLSVAIQPAEWSGGLRLPDGPGKEGPRRFWATLRASSKVMVTGLASKKR
jgi:hypothetical protein